MHIMKAITVRNVPEPLARALEAEKKRRGRSLNQTVLELLGQALGVEGPRLRSNGLRSLAGTWSQQELEDFEAATSTFDRVDDELWT